MSDNEIIAEFMGIKVAPYTHYAAGDMIVVVPEEGCLDWPTLTEYCPDKSWDLLMPVVEKIESLGCEIDIYKEICEISSSEDMIRWHTTNKIESTYKAVIEFINWYNQTKQK